LKNIGLISNCLEIISHRNFLAHNNQVKFLELYITSTMWATGAVQILTEIPSNVVGTLTFTTSQVPRVVMRDLERAGLEDALRSRKFAKLRRIRVRQRDKPWYEDKELGWVKKLLPLCNARGLLW
jgi:hypothetical protein